MRIFVDSDVVISSLISSTGAAYFLLNEFPIKPVVSSVSTRELRIVVERMKIKSESLEKLINKHLEVFSLKKNLEKIKGEYGKYVMDINDAHIVAGASEAGVKYLISYNLKHFKKDKIKDELGLILLTPALFLQYWRSQ